ncbi:MAG: hypothetical protein ACW99G_00430 [Candidatus Thorarchaeota archaeon]|jgi:hypothetical protein
MNIERQEAIIREKRTIEAVQKGLMGAGGKIGRIVKTLGSPIISNAGDSGLYDVRYFDDGIEEEYDLHTAKSHEDLLKNIPVMNVDGTIDPSEVDDTFTRKQDPTQFVGNEVGWVFDGLSRGMHLEIKYQEHKKELLVTFKGFPVYREVSGILESYRPLEEWESMIERLYFAAQQKNKQESQEEKKENIQEAERMKKNWIDRLRMKWGI